MMPTVHVGSVEYFLHPCNEIEVACSLARSSLHSANTWQPKCLCTVLLIAEDVSCGMWVVDGSKGSDSCILILETLQLHYFVCIILQDVRCLHLLVEASDVPQLSAAAAAGKYIDKWTHCMQVGAIHAGLECGIILEKVPGMDAVSYGPTIKGAHSPDERVEIATVAPFWEATLKILGRLAQAQA